MIIIFNPKEEHLLYDRKTLYNRQCFDLHHELKTSYANFRDDYVKKKSSILWNDLLDIYGEAPQNDNLWWKDFENMLGEVDYESLSKSRNGDALGFRKVRSLMEEKLPPLFGKWIKDVDSQIDASKIELMDEIDASSLFFTFNYTLLLEKAYQVKEENIWHIHGSVKHPDDIIVGHDADVGQLVKYTQKYNRDKPRISPSYADNINQEALNGAKKVREIIWKQSERFDQYRDIKHFIAMGFSFNEIDMPYIEKIWSINERKEDVDWILYWHSDGENMWMKEKIIGLGVSENNIITKHW